MHGNAEEWIWPPPKTPNMNIRKKKGKKILDYRPPPRPPFIQNGDEKGIRVPGKEMFARHRTKLQAPSKTPSKSL